jgi:putative ABC transport system ATP-binding protein
MVLMINDKNFRFIFPFSMRPMSGIFLVAIVNGRIAAQRKNFLQILKGWGGIKMATPIMELHDLGRVVDGQTLVTGINLTLFASEVLAITGPSGAGKTSLLRLLNRLDEPTQGTVLVDGKDYHQIEVSTLRRQLGMVLQQAYLFPGTVAENLRFGPLQHGQNLPEAAVEELLERVGLRGFAGQDVSKISGGEAQRVSLARTLANHPKVLLLDEPTSSLDEANRLGIENLILEIIRDNGMGCVMVTHDLEQAERMADKVLVLEGGRMLRMGGPGEVLHA